MVHYAAGKANEQRKLDTKKKTHLARYRHSSGSEIVVDQKDVFWLEIGVY